MAAPNIRRMRLLFASTAGAGHFNPLVPWIDLALERGHEVLVVGPPELGERAEQWYPFRAGSAPDPADGPDMSRIATMSHDEVGPLMIGELFARLNFGALLPTMQKSVDQWRPDLILRDPTEFASVVAATVAGVRQLRIGHGLADGEKEWLGYATSVLEGFRLGTTQAVIESPYLTMFPEELDPSPFPCTLRYRDEVAEGDGWPLPDWWPGHAAPLVYMTFGTVGPRMPQMLSVYRCALRAASQLNARVLMTVGHDLDITTLGSVPANVRVEQWVDQRWVFSKAAAVLSHGGSGTTLGALAAGCPQIVFPLFADQEANARCIQAAQVGLSVLDDTVGGAAALRRTRDSDDARMRAGIEEVLSRAQFVRTASQIASSMAQMPTRDLIGVGLEPSF
jgi:UDP:flavonoid glycosyltransferase YjiC (YdhE family)